MPPSSAGGLGADAADRSISAMRSAMRGSAAAKGASAGATRTWRDGFPGTGMPSTNVVGASEPGSLPSTRSAAAWKPSRKLRRRRDAREESAVAAFCSGASGEGGASPGGTGVPPVVTAVPVRTTGGSDARGGRRRLDSGDARSVTGLHHP